MGRPAALLLALLAGCGRFAFDPFGDAAGDARLGDARSDADAMSACNTYSEWSMPVEVSLLSSTVEDWDPALHPSGTTLVFRREQQGLWLATGSGASFSTPMRVPWSENSDSGAAWSPDGSTLYFSRALGFEHRLWASAFVGGTLQDPVQVADAASLDLWGPTITRDGLEMFYCDSAQGSRIHKLARLDRSAPWQFIGDEVGTDIANASTMFPGVTPDGLTLYYEVLDGTSARVYRATRANLGDAFSTPQIVQELATYNAGDPEVSADGLAMYLGMELTPALSAYDIVVVTRSCLD